MIEPNEDSQPEQEVVPPSPQGFVRSALFFYGVVGCVALVWRMLASDESILRPDGVAAEDAFGFGPALLIGMGVGGLALGFSEALTRWTALGDGLADLMGESLAGIGVGDAILLALASGLAEEMFFRGALQPEVGLVWASLIFGACHFVPRRELLLWSVFAVVIGAIFGLVYEWTGNLVAPIVAHTLINGVNLPRIAKRHQARPPEPEPDRER